MSAAVDPIHTLRRGVTNWGFWHVIKLDQPPGAPCWLVIDAYGPTDGVTDRGFLTNEQIDARDDLKVVYTPMDDYLWALVNGLKGTPDCTCGHVRHEGACNQAVPWLVGGFDGGFKACDCKTYRPNESQLV